MSVMELDFEESLRFVKERKTRLVWIGAEPVDYIRELLGIEQKHMVSLQPGSALSMGKKEAMLYKDCIFVCYHGNSSRYLAQVLRTKHGVESGSMRGGVTAVAGEIF